MAMHSILAPTVLILLTICSITTANNGYGPPNSKVKVDRELLTTTLERLVKMDITPNQQVPRTIVENHLTKLLHTTTVIPIQEINLCEVCYTVIDFLADMIVKQVRYEDVADLLILVCEMNIADSGIRPEMCTGFVHLVGSHMYKVLNMKNVTNTYFCTTLNFCEPETLPRPIELLPVELPNNQTEQPDTTYKIVHITDIHMDDEYEEGAATQCGYLTCCRYKWTGQGKAGKWGDYSCNTPTRTVDILLEEIKKMEPDIILYSGDSPTHAIWEETFEGQLNHSKMVLDHLKDKLNGTPVYLNLGNHETFPTNMYYIKRPEIKEMNKKFASWWSDLADLSLEGQRTIEEYGLYTSLIKPGLRIISFNTIHYIVYNWYSILAADSDDVRWQHSFLPVVLDYCRQMNEKVILMGHAPPGRYDTINFYAQYYSRLVLEFHDVIVLQVFGHTHDNEFKLFIDEKDNQAKAMYHVMSSLTTWRQANPSLRLYHMNNDTSQLMDYEQYYLDITKTYNTSNPPRLELLYSARKEYTLKDLTPASYQDLVLRMQNDPKLFDRYYSNKRSQADKSACGGRCRHEHFCFNSQATFHQYLSCSKTYVDPSPGTSTATPSGTSTQEPLTSQEVTSQTVTPTRPVSRAVCDAPTILYRMLLCVCVATMMASRRG